MKKAAVFVFLLLSFVLAFSVVYGEEEGQADWISSFAVNPYGGSEKDIDSIRVFQREEDLYLFLPSDTEAGKARIWFSAENALVIDGEKYKNGDACDSILQEGMHSLKPDGENTGERRIQTVCSENLPAVFITTESGSLEYIHENKTNRETGTLRIHEKGKPCSDLILKQINGRGNATWKYEKRPYNIGLQEPVELLGMSAAKKWTLLANYKDPTFLRNPMGWFLSEKYGLYYTSEYRFADLYINGEYKGNYTFCEKVEIGENRVEITDLEKINEELNGALGDLPRRGTGEGQEVLPGDAKGSRKWIEMPSEPEDISGGYLLELDMRDRYNAELCGFVTKYGQSVVIKDPEHAGRAETNYIADLAEEAFQALYASEGINEQGRHYSEYFDLDSFVSMYLVREFAIDIDAGLSSTFLFKGSQDEHLFFSPVWDLDRAFGDHLRRFTVDYGDPAIWWANSIGYFQETYNFPSVFNAAYRHPEFRKAVREKWNGTKEIRKELCAFIEEKSQMLYASAAMDAIRWNIYGSSDKSVMREKYIEACSDLVRFAEKRELALDKGFSEDAVMLYYDANGGNGCVFDPRILCKGEKTTIIGSYREESRILPPDDNHVFSHWNTNPDGTGISLSPGDEYTVEEDTVLYAIWCERPSLTAKVITVQENGDLILSVTRDDLLKAGMEPGDGIWIQVGDSLLLLPLYSGVYAGEGQAMLCVFPEQDNVVLTVRKGSFSETYGVSADAEIGIVLIQPDIYAGLQLINNLVVRQDREKYDSDEAYGNFRPVEMGSIAKGKLYRSVSPIYQNEKGMTTDRLIRTAEIRTVMNMAYTAEEVSAGMQEDFFRDSYYKQLFEQGNVFAEILPYTYTEEGFSDALIRGLSFLAEHDPPYLIHCHGGKDRTGFAAMILEMLMGADEDAIIRDYMQSYLNFYGIREYTDAYELIRDRNICGTLNKLKQAYPDADSLQSVARQYLAEKGMKEETLELLVTKLSESN